MPGCCQHRLARAQIVLGSLWIVDALLQVQPANLGPAAAKAVTENAMGQPAWARVLLERAGELVGHDPVAFSAVIATVQLLIGSAIVHRRSRRAGLLASIPWAVGVWVLGEGGGNLATGFAMLPSGAPGAALLYAVAAVAVLPGRSRRHPEPTCGSPAKARTAAGAGALGDRGTGAVWALLWSTAAILQVTPVGTLGFKLYANLQMTSLGEPAALATVDRRLGLLALAHGTIATGAAVAAELAIAAAGALDGRARGWLLTAALVACAIFWAIGESFGGLLTGTADDVGSMPLYALLAVLLFPLPRAEGTAADRELSLSAMSSLASTTRLSSFPTSSTSIRTTSPGRRLNGRSGTRDVPVDSTTPSGNAISRPSHETRSSRRRCSCDVEPSAS